MAWDPRHGPLGLRPAQPQKPRGPWPLPARFWGLGPGPGPIAHDMGPYVRWPCPMSYGPPLRPLALSYVLWPCPVSYGPVLSPMGHELESKPGDHRKYDSLPPPDPPPSEEDKAQGTRICTILHEIV